MSLARGGTRRAPIKNAPLALRERRLKSGDGVVSGARIRRDDEEVELRAGERTGFGQRKLAGAVGRAEDIAATRDRILMGLRDEEDALGRGCDGQQGESGLR